MPDGTEAVAAPETAANGAAPETEAPAPVTQESIDRVLNRVEELGGTVNQLAERIPAQESAGTEPDDPVAALLSEMGYETPEQEPEPEYDEGGLDQRDLAELVMAATQKAVQAQYQEQVQPHLTQIAEERLEAAFGDLEQRFPKLVEDESWRDRVLDTAEQIAGGEKRLLENPKFIEAVHKSLLADEHAANETPVGGADAGLERPTGANPASAGGDPQEMAARIVQAKGHQVLRDKGLV